MYLLDATASSFSAFRRDATDVAEVADDGAIDAAVPRSGGGSGRENHFRNLNVQHHRRHSNTHVRRRCVDFVTFSVR